MFLEFAFWSKFKNSNDYEKRLLLKYAYYNNLKINYYKDVENIPETSIVVGDISFVDSYLKYKNINLTIDYYPIFMKEFISRKIWYTNKWPFSEKCFIKSADKYKLISGFIKKSNSYKGNKKSCKLFVCSEIVNIKREWRYYITNGKILCAFDYTDFNNQVDAPKININLPSDFCGAIDIALLENDKFELIEVQHPFSCGFYGPKEDFLLYGEWIVFGWKYLIKK